MPLLSVQSPIGLQTAAALTPYRGRSRTSRRRSTSASSRRRKWRTLLSRMSWSRSRVADRLSFRRSLFGLHWTVNAYRERSRSTKTVSATSRLWVPRRSVCAGKAVWRGCILTHTADILFSNVKHLFFQPCDHELLVIIHVHLKAPIMIGKKKAHVGRFLFFFVTVEISSGYVGRSILSRGV